MKILIAADMEGISGVVHWDQVDSSHSEYQRARIWMTNDVNSAIRGVFEAGADEVLVTDGHANGMNLLVEELDPRVKLHFGSPSELSMVEGVQSGVDGTLFIGYHARSGAQSSSLEHTWSGNILDVNLNGTPVGEIGLNAAVCGHYDVPVLMISGDQVACGEAMRLLGEIETAVVKKATSRLGAWLISPTKTGSMICDAAANAVIRLRNGRAPAPYRIDPPISLMVEFSQSQMADRASILPGTVRSGRLIEYTSDDMVTAYRAFRSIVSLGR